MRKGTQIALVLFMAATAAGTTYAIHVPKLKKKVEALEQNQAFLEARLHAYVQQGRQQSITIRELQKELEEKEAALRKVTKELEATKQKSTVRAASLTSRGGNHVRELTGFEVTWYNNHGTTASGRVTQDGVTAAVDPRVIPLGTWFEIIFPDGTVLKRRADDTGGAVKGRVVDVYANAPKGELLERGRTRNVRIRILGKE